MQTLLDYLIKTKEFKQIQNSVDAKSTPILLPETNIVYCAYFAASLYKKTSNPITIICSDDASCSNLISDIESFVHSSTNFLPPRDFNFYNIEASSKEWEHKRITAFYNMLKGNKITVTTPQALSSATIHPNDFTKHELIFEINKEYNTESIITQLISLGYKRFMQVEGAGGFSLRGGILDIFSPIYQNPVRIEFFDTVIDTMAFFDTDTQRRTGPIEKFTATVNSETCFIPGDKIADIKTANEELKSTLAKDIERYENTGVCSDRYIPLMNMAFGADYIKGTVIILESAKTEDSLSSYISGINEDTNLLISRNIISKKHSKFILSSDEFYNKLSGNPLILMEHFLSKPKNIKPKSIIPAGVVPIKHGDIIACAKEYMDRGFKTILLTNSSIKTSTFLEELKEYTKNDGIPGNSCYSILHGSLSGSFEYKDTVVLSDGIYQKARKKTRTNKNAIKSFTDLVIGDLVVHEHHGIARFTGIQNIVSDGSSRDYIRLAFAGSDTLFVPATALNLISKYIGSDNIKVNKLNSHAWKSAKLKAQLSAKDLAKDLIALYAKRSVLKGFSFPPDDDIQNEFDNNFPYIETDDQLKAISDIKKDMQSTKPMDRLLCGDVGFGKTEVALRAVMKCILAGKQAVLLVPTTVLATQHFHTAINRFKSFAISIEMLSRFKTAKEQKNILIGLENGSIDLIIGTHKLFLKDIKFKDLGLLIIDEEQRFGVSHKEKLKKLSENIDVLTLSATPIPRTLNMALSGVRDMSMLEVPPAERSPVVTYVMEYDETTILDALKREHARNGQSFYIHNNTETIYPLANKLKSLLPDFNIATAHGKMSQKELNSIMEDMTNGFIDILICTTIIETGIDIANVNTLIIEGSDTMGLSQLHQLRGRVGRSNRHSYAYLTYKKGKVLSEISVKRLTALREYTEFGAGFKIAMRDLSIRGAGNVLGSEQSGHLLNIGYDLYLKILESAVLEEKGISPLSECNIDISINACIPHDYIDDVGIRIDLYRRIAAINSKEDFENMIDEIIDRFGDMPSSVYNLCRISYIKHLGCLNDITDIQYKNTELTLIWNKGDFARLSLLCADIQFKARLFPESKPYITIKIPPKINILTYLEDIITKYFNIN